MAARSPWNLSTLEFIHIRCVRVRYVRGAFGLRMPYSAMMTRVPLASKAALSASVIPLSVMSARKSKPLMVANARFPILDESATTYASEARRAMSELTEASPRRSPWDPPRGQSRSPR